MWDERSRAKYDAASEALEILDRAAMNALDRVLEEVHGFGQSFAALETYRWVANAREHVRRAQREALGLDRRGDPCMPGWSR